MRKLKLIVLSFITLDGVVQGDGGPEEDPTGGFTYGGWSIPLPCCLVRTFKRSWARIKMH